jgi:hypothetical protein
MKVKGKIKRISKTSITIQATPEWTYDHDYKQWRPQQCPVTMTLKLEPALIDKAIASYKHLLEFQIKEGKVTNIKIVKPPPPPPADITDILLAGTPRGFREKLRTVLETLQELEQKQTYVPYVELIEKLREEKIPPELAGKLINHLLCEGTIYEPKEGYLKKT